MMNSIHLQLLELLQMAETPLYSAYRWLSRQLGRNLSLAAFLQLIEEPIKNDVIQLWSFDCRTEEKSLLGDIPPGLANRYLSTEELDDSFDPFDLTLTLGPAADLGVRPLWVVDLDFEDRRFALRALSTEAVAGAIEELGRLFQGVKLVETSRVMQREEIRVEGLIV